MTTTEAGTTVQTQLQPFAGFWRRLAAFVIDALLLGCAGMLLGWLAFDTLAALGGWGRLVGFALALPYLGLMNSRVAGGRTLGKRLLGLRTVGLDGVLLSPTRGLFRAAVLALPWFLNGAVVAPDLLQVMPLAMLLSLLVFGLGLGTVYLLVFNRPSRRSLHDLAAGSVVVREPLPAGGTLGGRLWQGHLAATGVLALLALALPVAMQTLMGDKDAIAMMAMRSTVLELQGVRQAGITKGWASVRSTQGSSTTTYLAVQAFTGPAELESEALCNRIAAALLERHPSEAEPVDRLVVITMYGYDLGIASARRSRQVSLSPQEWRERLH